MPRSRRPDTATQEAITAALDQIEAAEAQLVQAVADARAGGCSWSEIGRILGVSRQAAWERFHRRVGLRD